VFENGQISLFDSAPGGPQIDDLTTTARRTELGSGAWVDHAPNWVRGSDEVFTRLLHTVDWQRERRPMYDRVVDVPRLLRFYAEDEPMPDPLLIELHAALDEHYRRELGEPFATVGMCCYRDGGDSVAWHGTPSGAAARRTRWSRSSRSDNRVRFCFDPEPGVVRCATNSGMAIFL
jgi:alkylated DNA repair dioxygenase AlkB